VNITLPEQDHDKGLVCLCSCLFVKRLGPSGSSRRLALRLYRGIGYGAKGLKESPGSEDDR
jgi:hypothetical protein